MSETQTANSEEVKTKVADDVEKKNNNFVNFYNAATNNF